MHELTFLWKDDTSQINDCPALYKTDGGFVVQGKVLDPQTRAALHQLGSDEDAVFVPDNVLDRLASYRADNA